MKHYVNAYFLVSKISIMLIAFDQTLLIFDQKTIVLRY